MSKIPKQNRAHQATIKSVQKRLAQILIPELQSKLLDGYRLVSIGQYGKAFLLQAPGNHHCIIALRALDGLGIHSNWDASYISLFELERIRLNASVVLRYLRAASNGHFVTKVTGNTWWSQIEIGPKNTRGAWDHTKGTSTEKIERYKRLAIDIRTKKPTPREKGKAVQRVFDALSSITRPSRYSAKNQLLLAKLGPRQAKDLCNRIKEDKALSESLLVINWYDGPIDKETKLLVEGLSKESENIIRRILFISGESSSALVNYNGGLLREGYPRVIVPSLHAVSCNDYYNKNGGKDGWNWKVPAAK